MERPTIKLGCVLRRSTVDAFGAALFFFWLTLPWLGAKGMGAEGMGAKAATLKLAAPKDPGLADPQRNTEFHTIALNCYDRLVESRANPDGTSDIVPSLATAWTVSPDGLVYTFTLRDDVRFHHGEPFTAADVVHTVERMLDPATRALATELFDAVDGAKARLDGDQAAPLGVRPLGPQRVEFRLAKPYAPFLAMLASPGASILPKGFAKAAGARFGQDADATSGTGPYRLAERRLNEGFRLEAVSGGMHPPPGFDRVEVRVVEDPETLRILFLSGELDLFDADFAPAQLDFFLAHPAWRDRVAHARRVGLFYLTFNQAKPRFADPRIRRAALMGIDRERIVQKKYAGRGRVVAGVLPPGLWGFNPELAPVPFDPDGARRLVEEAGGPPVPFELAGVEGFPRRAADLNEILRWTLRDVGFAPTLLRFDQAGFLSLRRAGDAPAHVQQWSADFNDPDNFFSTFFSRSGAKARSLNFSDETIFAEVDAQRAEVDPEARIRRCRDLERKIMDRTLWAPLYSLDHFYVVGPRIARFTPPWNGWSDMPLAPLKPAEDADGRIKP